MGWVVGWSVPVINKFNSKWLGVGLFLINFAKEGRKLIEYKINGRMSAMLVSGKDFSMTRYVMSDDIDDIQDARYYMRRRTFF